MTTDFIANQWGSVDRAADPSRFVRYLDTVGSLKTMQCIKQRTYDLLDIEEGDQLLDVGCGTGDDVRALARNVGPTGHVVGIDGSERMVAEARIRAKEANLPVEFRVGNAERLEFADSVFDGCRAERLLIHLKNPERALAELVRVTRPGARIVVFDADWETLIIDAPHRGTTRKILDFHCDSIRSGWVGRQLHRLFYEAGLGDVVLVAETLVFTDYPQADFVLRLGEAVTQAITAGVVSESEANEWLDDLERAQQRGTFFAAVTGFCVSGRKP